MKSLWTLFFFGFLLIGYPASSDELQNPSFLLPVKPLKIPKETILYIYCGPGFKVEIKGKGRDARTYDCRKGETIAIPTESGDLETIIF